MKLDELILNQTTRASLERILVNPPHSLLVAGETGTGKETLAQALCCQLLNMNSLDQSPYSLQVWPDGSTFTIEQVREITRFLKLKTTGRTGIRRALILHNCEKMNHVSQNGLLKTLEEPPADTIIVLSVTQTKALKATIRSRAQLINVLPLPLESATDYFKTKGHALNDINRAYLLSNGAIGLMSALLEDKQHPFYKQIDEAKKICQMSAFDKLTIVDGLSKDRDKVIWLLDALQRIAKAGLHHAVANSANEAANRWRRQLSAVHKAQGYMTHNPNLKLLLSDLFLQM